VEHQSEVLLRLGLSTVKIISKNSGVARPDVYRVMAELEKLSLVEKIISAPRKFRAISISDAFLVLMERRKKETSDLQAATRDILKKFKNNKARMAPEEDESRFSLVPEQVAVRKEEKALKNVHRSFDVVTSWRDPHAMMFIDTEDIADALQRGVEIRVIIDKPDEEELLSNIMKHLKKYPTFKTRWLLNSPKALMSVYDKEEAWVCTCTNPGLKECPTLWTNNPCLLSILQDYFEILWVTAVKINSLNNEPD
jgi:sugar-specific transcriptional regulator TrmB